MRVAGNAGRGFADVLLALAAVVLLSVAAPDMVLAGRGGDDFSRAEFYGIVQARPESGLHGQWIIGGRAVATGVGTEFDQTEGELAVGGCAKVHMRDGRVHEIDSEPMRNCR